MSSSIPEREQAGFQRISLFFPSPNLPTCIPSTRRVPWFDFVGCRPGVSVYSQPRIETRQQPDHHPPTLRRMPLMLPPGQLGQSVTSNDDTFEGFTFVDSSSHLLNTTNNGGGRTPTTATAAGGGGSTATPHAGGARAAAAGAFSAAAAAKAAAAAAAGGGGALGLHAQQRVMVDAMEMPDV